MPSFDIMYATFPESFGGRAQNRLRPDGARVIHQNIEPSELLDGALHQVTYGILLAHIGRNRQGATPQRADRICRLVDAAGQAFGGVLAFGRHRNVGAFLGKPDGEGTPDAAAGSGHDGHSARQVGMKNGSHSLD
jgi:hypothetical protein